MLTTNARRVLNKRALIQTKNFDLQSFIKNTPAASSAAIIQHATLMAPGAGYFTMNRTNLAAQTKPIFGGPDATAFFSTASGSDFSDSESELDTDSEREDQRPHRGHRAENVKNFNMYKNFEPQTVYDEVSEALAQGDFSNYSDQQVQIMLQRVIRSYHKSFQLAIQNKETIENLLIRVHERLQDGQSQNAQDTAETSSDVADDVTATSRSPIPIYFHDLVSLLKQGNKMRFQTNIRNDLRRDLSEIVNRELQGRDISKADPMLADSHSTQITNIIEFLYVNQSIGNLFKMITNRIVDDREPKPVQTLNKVLGIFSRDFHRFQRNKQSYQTIINYLDDEKKFSFEREEGDSLAVMLMLIGKCCQNDLFKNRQVASVTSKLLAQLSSNPSMLQESGVLLAIEGTEIIQSSALPQNVKNQANQLQYQVIQLVLELAEQNLQLVHPKFLFEFSHKVAMSSTLQNHQHKAQIYKKVRNLITTKLNQDDSTSFFVENSWDLERFATIANKFRIPDLKQAVYKSLQSPKKKRIDLVRVSKIADLIYSDNTLSLEEKKQISATYLQNNREIRRDQQQDNLALQLLMGLNVLTRDKPGEASELASEIRENLQEILNQNDGLHMDVMACKHLIEATNKYYTSYRIPDQGVSQHLDTVLETIIPGQLRNYLTLKELLIESLESKNEFGSKLNAQCVAQLKKYNNDSLRKRDGSEVVEEGEDDNDVDQPLEERHLVMFASQGIGKYFSLMQNKDPNLGFYAYNLLTKVRELFGKPTLKITGDKMRRLAEVICSDLSGMSEQEAQRVRNAGFGLTENAFAAVTDVESLQNPKEIFSVFFSENKSFGKLTQFTRTRLNAFLESKEQCKENINLYVNLVSELGYKRLGRSQRDVFREIVEADDFNRNDAIRRPLFGVRNDKFREFLFDNMVYNISAIDNLDSKVTKEKLSETFGNLLETEARQMKQFSDLDLIREVDFSVLQDNRNQLRSFISEIIVGDQENPNLRMDYMKALLDHKGASTQQTNMIRNISLAIVRVACKDQIESEDGLSTKEFLYCLNHFASSQWKDLSIYNSFIKGFGARFEIMSVEDQVSFCMSLAKAKLNQKDIFQAVLDNVLDVCDKRTNQHQFTNRAILNMLQCCLTLDMTDVDQFEQMLDQDFQSKYFRGDITRAEGFEAQYIKDFSLSSIALGLIARLDLNENAAGNALARNIIKYLDQNSKNNRKLDKQVTWQLIRQIISNEQTRTSIFGEDSETLTSLPQFSDDLVLQEQGILYQQIKNALKQIGADKFEIENVEQKNMPVLLTVEQNEEAKRFIAIRKVFMSLIDGRTLHANQAAKVKFLQALHPDAQILDQDEFKALESDTAALGKILVNKYGLQDLGSSVEQEEKESTEQQKETSA